MEPKEEMKSGETPAVDQPAVESVKAEVKPAPAKKSFWSKLLPWVIVAVVFYLGGLATIFFAVYQPAKNAAAAAAADADKQITELTDKVAQAEIDISTVRTELDTMKADLTAAQTTIADQTTQLAKIKQMEIVYKFLVDVSGARAALEKLDTNTALQSINFAKADLTELQATEIDAASLSGFGELLDTATSKISEPDLLTSRSALDTLYSNLLNLVNNLK
jgi:cytoskeletal protein RodZ